MFCECRPFLSSRHPKNIPGIYIFKLPGIPRLESARLLHFEGPLALLSGDGVASVGSDSQSLARTAPNALFYNPFDDGAEGDGFDIGGGGWDDDDGDSDGTGGGAGKAGAGTFFFTSMQGKGGGGEARAGSFQPCFEVFHFKYLVPGTSLFWCGVKSVRSSLLTKVKGKA